MGMWHMQILNRITIRLGSRSDCPVIAGDLVDALCAIRAIDTDVVSPHRDPLSLEKGQ